jgi:hypothetical protein
MRFSKKLMITIMIAGAIVTSASRPTSPYTTEIGEIEVSLKALQARFTTAQNLNWNSPDVAAVLNHMKKFAAELDVGSATGPSEAVTDVATRYLSALADLHILYAQAAHSSGSQSSQFDFSALESYRLRLHEDAARPVIAQKPFSARHAGGGEIEFFITSEEKQLAEFMSLESPKSEFNYAALVQFASVREAFVNLWALQRLSLSSSQLRQVNACAPDLLSFRFKGGDLKTSEPYLQLVALDQYNTISTGLSGTFDATRDFQLAQGPDYYHVLTQVFSSAPEFKTYIQGVAPSDVSKWLNSAADAVAKNEQTDWLSDAENSKKILASSTLVDDDLAPNAVAGRMAEAVVSRHLQSAAAQITNIATGNLKMADSPALQAKIESAMQPLQTPAASALLAKLVPSLKDIEKGNQPEKIIYDRVQAKVNEITPVAADLMPAVHDEFLLKTLPLENSMAMASSGGVAMPPAIAPNLNARRQYQYTIADSTTFKTYLVSQIQRNSSLWKKLNSDSTGKSAFNQFLLELDQAVAGAIQQMGPNAPREQVSERILALAQANAHSKLAKIPAQSTTQATLNQAFDTVHLFSAKRPTDLAPDDSAQLNLVRLAIAAGYRSAPLLGTKWTDNGLAKKYLVLRYFDDGKTLLYRLYDDAWKGGKLTSDVSSLTIAAIKNATQLNSGKLEDFCQANPHDMHDQHFRDMFESASHLRDILGHSQDEALSAQLRSYDTDLVKKTETKMEQVSKIVDPILTVVMVATGVLVLLGMFGPASLAIALPMWMAILNFYVMAPLSAVSLYVTLGSDFIQKPAQLAYQDALASAQISAADPFSDWEQLKKMGLLSSTTDRISVDKERSQLTRSQLTTVASLPMDIWYGASIVQGARLATGAIGVEKMTELFGGEIPFGETTLRPAALSKFRDLVERDGVLSALKQKSAQVSDQMQVISGMKPTYGAYTAAEGTLALKTALSRALDSGVKEVVPGIHRYTEFLVARLKVTQGLSNVKPEAAADIVAPPAGEEIPSEITEDSDRALSEVPDQILGMTGGLSWKEWIENPKLRKFGILPKSAFQAVREGHFSEWLRKYGALNQQVNELRGEFIVQKITSLERLEQKLTQAIAQGDGAAKIIASLSDEDLVLLEEAARGPHFLAYGYWNMKLASFHLASAPLKSLLSIFDDYHEMLRSLRPFDMDMGSSEKDSDREDALKYYHSVRELDGVMLSGRSASDPTQTLNTSAAVQLQSLIDRQITP